MTTSRDGCVVPRDGCVVPTAPLSELVRVFVEDWVKTRPPTKGRRGRALDHVEPFGAYEFLAQETGLPTTVIRRVRSGVSRQTELRIADELVKAIGNPGMFHDQLPVSPNPKARPAAQLECCGRIANRDGSSLTGSAARQRR